MSTAPSLRPERSDPDGSVPERSAQDGAVPDRAGRTSAQPRRPLLPALTGVFSFVFAVVATVWLARPSTNPFADPDSWLRPGSTLLGSVLSAEVSAAVLVGLCAVGVLVSAVAAATAAVPVRQWRWAHPVVGGFGVVFAAVVGLGLLTETAIMTAGYLMAMTVAVGLVVLGVQLIRTYRLARWFVVAAAAALVGVFATGILPFSALTDIAGNLAGLWGEAGPIALVLGLSATTLLWVVLSGMAWREAGVLDGVSGWVLRHRRVITIIAAMGPLPYAVVRLTWLTPWPYGFADGGLEMSIRIWGLMLSSGAWAGFVLTLGLIRPWGEIFPRWMPRVAGRPVPVWFAAAPGALVSVILCVSAVPMIRSFADLSVVEAVKAALIFPMWLWGPALALAVWGYVQHRRGPEASSVTSVRHG